jgi:hypothetical protein
MKFQDDGSTPAYRAQQAAYGRGIGRVFDERGRPLRRRRPMFKIAFWLLVIGVTGPFAILYAGFLAMVVMQAAGR